MDAQRPVGVATFCLAYEIQYNYMPHSSWNSVVTCDVYMGGVLELLQSSPIRLMFVQCHCLYHR